MFFLNMQLSIVVYSYAGVYDIKTLCTMVDTINRQL